MSLFYNSVKFGEDINQKIAALGAMQRADIPSPPTASPSPSIKETLYDHEGRLRSLEAKLGSIELALNRLCQVLQAQVGIDFTSP
jgi:hypothetical protein